LKRLLAKSDTVRRAKAPVLMRFGRARRDMFRPVVGTFLAWLPPLLATICLLLTSCSSLPPLEPVDLHQEGWTVRTGEGVWRGNRNSPEISGEIMIAHRTNGDEFVAYTKTPFAMVLAQQRGGAWQIESPSRHKRHTGRGKAPGSILWLHLPQVAQGKEPGLGWTLKRESESRWRLEHDSDGEAIEVFLSK
jgi:hypothetical protein